MGVYNSVRDKGSRMMRCPKILERLPHPGPLSLPCPRLRLPVMPSRACWPWSCSASSLPCLAPGALLSLCRPGVACRRQLGRSRGWDPITSPKLRAVPEHREQTTRWARGTSSPHAGRSRLLPDKSEVQSGFLLCRVQTSALQGPKTKSQQRPVGPAGPLGTSTGPA